MVTNVTLKTEGSTSRPPQVNAKSYQEAKLSGHQRYPIRNMETFNQDAYQYTWGDPGNIMNQDGTALQGAFNYGTVNKTNANSTDLPSGLQTV